MSEIPGKLEEFLDNLSLLNDEDLRTQILIDYADKFKEVPPEISVKPYPDENKVAFCESGAYVWTIMQKDNTPKFYFAVENPHGVSAKALSAIFDKTLSGQSPEKILNVSADVIDKIFGKTLSMGKNLGLSGILFMMQKDVKNKIERLKRLKD